jgi:hypothetical protein
LVEEIRDKTNTERKQLTAIEVEKLLAAAKGTRHEARALRLKQPARWTDLVLSLD